MPTPQLRPAASGVYYAHWSTNRRSARKSMGTADRATAERRFAQWLLTRHDQSVQNLHTLTVADCWSVYRAHRVPQLASPDTVLHSWAVLEPHFGVLRADGVSQRDVDAYVVRRTRTVQSQTVRRELAALIAMLNFAAAPARALIRTAPVLALPAAAEPRDRWLRMHEMQALLTAARTLRGGDRLSRGERFLWIALETAARVQAILDLTWDRVDFDAGVIHFDVPGRKRTTKRRAAVSISSALRPVLERAYRERTGPVVMDHGGAVWAVLKRIAAVAGVEGVSPHVLRHSAATAMARNGVSLFVISKVLGNSYQVVEKVYAKWCPDDPAATVDRISNGVLEYAE
jgi:integrase